MARSLSLSKNCLIKTARRLFGFFQKPEHFWALSLALLILVTPLAVKAGIGELFLQAVNYFLGAVKAFAGWVLELAGQLLGWVMSPQFNNLPLTHGHIVDVGWEILRQLANMFFIVALLIIAFATILGLESYGMRRQLPILIAMILLVNFSRVIAGVIVDASNILMNFFLSGGIAQGSIQDIPLQLAQFMKVGDLFEPGSGIIDTFSRLTTFGGEAQNFAANLFAIFFMLLAAWIFFIFAILFVARIVAIWIITILAPAAFVLTVLPGLSQWGIKEWFKRLTSWAFVGAGAAFFIFLTALLGSELNRQGAAIFSNFNPQDIETSAQFIGFIGDFAPFLIYLTVFAFLFIGYKIVVSAVPQGADTVVNAVDNLGKKYAKRVGAWTKGLPGRGIKGLGRAAKQTAIASGAAQKAAEALSRIPVAGRRAARGIYGAINKAREQAEEIEKSLKGASDAVVQRYMGRINAPAVRAAAAKILAERGKITRPQAQNMYTLSQRLGGDFRKSLEKAVPSLKQKPVAETFAGIKPADFPSVVSSEIDYYFEPQRAAETAQAINARQLRMMGREGSLEQKKSIIKGYAGLSDQQLNQLSNDVVERLSSSAYASAKQAASQEGINLTRLNQRIQRFQQQQQQGGGP